jgi:hypothetical protein
MLILKGFGFKDIWLQLSKTVLFAFIIYGLAVWIYKKKCYCLFLMKKA